MCWRRLESLVLQPHGIILVTGPTGSGKTTTLYAALQRLDATRNNIMTVEDPIEYELPGVGQTQVNSKIELTFAKALRAILRQDPDIIMIGEIRDFETAQIAIQASLTGHLVLATLHTNDAASAVTRLTDMGVEPFLLSSSLLGVLAQRLVRKLCTSCGGAGCGECGQTGYQGRTGVFELLVTDDNMRALIHNQVAEADIRAAALKAGMSLMRDDGERLVRSGITSREELVRVTTRVLTRMPAYTFEAIDAQGQTRKGVIDAETAKAARSTLRAQSLVPLLVEPVKGGVPGAAGTAKRGGWKNINIYTSRIFNTTALTIWTRQVAGLVSSGLPLERALTALSEESTDERQRNLVASLRSEVNSGSTFSKALSQHPREFSDIYTAVIGAGEQSGNLGVVLERLADDLEERQTLRGKLIGAMLYPAIVTLIAIVIVMFLVGYVVPQVANVFAGSKRALPLLTVVMLGISDVVKNYGWLALLVLVAGGIGAKFLLANEAIRQRFDAAVLTLPLVGPLARGYNAARFTGTLAMLAGAGVPILKALQAAAETLGNQRAARRCAGRAGAGARRRAAGVGAGAEKAFSGLAVDVCAPGRADGATACDAATRGPAAQRRGATPRVCAGHHPGAAADCGDGHGGDADRARGAAAHHRAQPARQVAWAHHSTASWWSRSRRGRCSTSKRRTAFSTLAIFKPTCNSSWSGWMYRQHKGLRIR